MKIRLLFVLMVLTVKVSLAQYCGTSGANICSANNTFTSPGITDYTTFPCVHNSTPYSQVVQVLFPDSVFQFGLWIPVDTIVIDSITNLPCGLCWSCDNSTFTYMGGSRACLLLSGTANDVAGAYQINMYGTAHTALGNFSGSLENLGFQFFLNVVAQNAPCSPINILNLNKACSQTLPAPVNCNFTVQLSSSNPVTNCHFDSTTLTVVQPTGPGYKYYWTVFPDSINIFPPNIIEDSGQTFQIIGTSGQPSLEIFDSITGCSTIPPLDFTSTSGFFHVPSVCYATCDSSLTQNNGITLVFEKDDWFNNIANYTLYRQDSLGQNYLLTVGQIAGAATGKIIDTFSRVTGNSTLNGAPFYTDIYTLGAVTTCGDAASNYDGFTPSILTVDTMVGGLPLLVWNNSVPLTYSGVYIFSRYPGGSWRLRFSSITLTDTTWVDQAPDSTQMQYMLGYTLTVNCDPNRASNMSFSNFRTISVAPQLVVPDTTHTTTPTGSQNLVSANDILLYPNPATDKLYLQLADVKTISTLQYNIYDVLGQSVSTGPLNVTQRQELNVANLSAGIYAVSIQADKQAPVVKMFVKQ